MGSGTSLACAHEVASRIQRLSGPAAAATPVARGKKRQAAFRTGLSSIKFECIQFAGTTVGTVNFKSACERLKIKTYYVALEDTSADKAGTDQQFDPVTYMPYGGTEHTQVADRFFVLDLAAGEDTKQQPLKLYSTTYNRWRCLKTLKVNHNTVNWMAAAFILGDRLAAKTGLHGFMYVHMKGEEALRQLLMVAMLRKQLLGDWLRYTPAH